MLLQTNSYVVPKDKRSEHVRVLRRFRQTMARLGCDSFEVYEQVGNNWSSSQAAGRFIQIMKFRDRKHQLAVQQAEQGDPAAQQQIAEFCQLVNIPYQQQQGLFAVGYYTAALPIAPPREVREQAETAAAEAAIPVMPVEPLTAPVPVSIDAGPFEPAAGPAAESNGNLAAAEEPLTATVVTVVEASDAVVPHNGNGEVHADIIDIPLENIVVSDNHVENSTRLLDIPRRSDIEDNFDSLLDELREPAPTDQPHH